MEEIWKPCPFAEESHMVSNLGRVKKLAHFRKYRNVDIWKKEIILKHSISIHGYVLMSITNDFIKGENHSVHRLVALAFLQKPNPDTKNQINHIDGDKTNNIVTNLEWCTHSENLIHAFQQLNKKVNLRPTRGEKSAMAKITDAQALEILNSNDRATVLAKKYGVHRDTIYNIQSGKRHAHIHKLKDKSLSGNYRKRVSEKLDFNKAKEIRESRTISTMVLAIKYGVSKATIKNVRAGKIWREK